MEIFFIGISLIIFNTIGQLLLKKAAAIGGARNAYLWLGYTLFAMTIFVSYFLMKYLELKYFTLIMSLNYLTVMFGAAIFFDERLTRIKIFGTLLVLIGVFIFMKGIL